MTETTINIDFFEFAFLVEACIPPTPIARSTFWIDVVNKHYHILKQSERNHLYEWISSTIKFKDSMRDKNDLANLFKCRYNPDNQYMVHTVYDGKYDDILAFMYETRMCTVKDRFIQPEFIISIDKVKL